MSWFKKTVRKVKKAIRKDWRKISKSAKRLANGKFHLGHQIRTTLPKFAQKRFDKFRWSKFVKSRLGFAHGNNSAASISFVGDAPSNGYVYNGKSISELM